ncbi:MAG: hypothetical protein KC502_16000 [Myxococcales bacterium]|nr:hypothetical protein [Myxococcales bacterium]
MVSLLLRLSAALLAIVILQGCGSNLLSYLNDSDKLTYAQQCAKRADGHTGEVNGGRYFTPEFVVERWPGALTKGSNVNETHLVKALKAGTSRFVLVEARGGLGKTRMAEAINARTCGTTPIFTIDLNKDVAMKTAKGGGNPIIRRIAAQLGISADVTDQARLDELLRSHRWILLADAIEEVDLLKRPSVAIAVAKLRMAYPKTAQVVIFARPPVIAAKYGFGGVDTHLRIKLVNCDRAKKVVQSITGSEAEAKRYWSFAKRYGFDKQMTVGYGCIYPYLATYRDIHKLKKLALSKKKGSAIDSYASAHQYLVAVRLQKELAKLNWGQREALDMVDRMFRIHLEKKGSGAPLFGIVDCMKSIDPQYGWTAVDAGVGGTAAQRRRQVCEKALQAVVFQKVGDKHGEEGRWKFFDTGMRALFRARWINSELAKQPTGACQMLTKYADHVRSPETLRFLVAQPVVQRCLAPTLRLLCAKDAKRAKHLDRLIEGLPGGQKRFQMVEEARAFEAENGKLACVVDSLDAIAKTIAIK